MIIKEWITDRLILKLSTEDDIKYLAPMLLDENVTMYLCEHITKIPTIEIAESFLSSIINYYQLVFTIRIKETNEIIGQIGYCDDSGQLSISYWLGTKYQRKGYASEAAVELSYYVFINSRYDTFSISFHSKNIGSRKLAYKIGELMLERNPKWIVKDKEDQITECEILDLNDDYITIRMKIINDTKTSYLSCKKNFIPEKYLKSGKKYTEILRYFDISKNGN